MLSKMQTYIHKYKILHKLTYTHKYKILHKFESDNLSLIFYQFPPQIKKVYPKLVEFMIW